MEAKPTLKPITSDDAKLIFEGKISCDTLIHKGSVDIEKNPTIMKKTTGKMPPALNIKYINGVDKSSPA